jgi:hypothetical protein
VSTTHFTPSPAAPELPPLQQTYIDTYSISTPRHIHSFSFNTLAVFFILLSPLLLLLKKRKRSGIKVAAFTAKI